MVDMVDKNVGVDIPSKVRVTCDVAPLYLGDNTEYEGVGTLRNGDIAEVAGISLETGWYAVRVPRYILWVDSSLCEAVGNEEEKTGEE